VTLAVHGPRRALRRLTHTPSGEVVFFSLSHKRFGVSYCEIRRARIHGTVLRAAVTSADSGYTRLAERSVSRCGTHQALCDRLFYASPGLDVNFRFCRIGRVWSGAIQPVSATSSLSVDKQLAQQRTPDQADRTESTKPGNPATVSDSDGQG